MNNFDGFSNFFWNLVPGGIFTAILYSQKLIDYGFPYDKQNNELNALLFVLLSLLFGSIFQGIQFVFRKLLDPLIIKVWARVTMSYGIAEERMINIGVFDGMWKVNKVRIMNHYSQANKAGFLIIDLSKKSTLWGNIFIALVSLCVFVARISWSWILPIAVIGGLIIYLFYLVSYYDAILKAFIAVTSRNPKNSNLQKCRENI